MGKVALQRCCGIRWDFRRTVKLYIEVRVLKKGEFYDIESDGA